MKVLRILLLVAGLPFLMTGEKSFGQTSQSKTSLSLKNVISLAITQSSAIKYAQNRDVNYYWRWKNFRTRFRPQLVLSGDIPNYAQTTTPVTQPDGSVEFKNISQLAASTNLALNQFIPQTGTSIYAVTSLYGIQDFNNNTTSFSGNPFSIGFTQPIFAYNWAKWARRTEPLVYEEAQKNFIESIEEISHAATSRFFRYLTIQTNFSLAESNLKNSQDNLKIAQVKQRLGEISENDFSRIKLSVLNAQKALSKAEMDLKNADYELKRYTGLDQDIIIDLEIPLEMILYEVDSEIALSEALQNRKETPEFERRLIDAERGLVRAKRSQGLSATLRGNFGLSNSADNIPGVYQNPEQQQAVRLSMSIPILDWGRSKSGVKLAESRRDLIIYDVEQDRSDFERLIIVQVEQFNLIKDQLLTAHEADKVAEDGYKIALKKFQNGEISITDLNISLAERESAKRDYISSIENYWESYYMIRILTLYDFELGEKIWYDNPMLDD
ncbi:MAG: TolC family protein [Bacteroidales bacterium]|nr:TolC family protein [Bacteroidales bacterium]